MSWRMHFTAEDLARTRVTATLGPLAETMFGMSLLRCTTQRPVGFNDWRKQARASLSVEMKPLSALLPQGTWGVDLWTLTGEAPTIAAGIDALLTAPRDRVAAEMEFFSKFARLPPSAWSVVNENGSGRVELANAAYAAFQVLVESHWTRVETHLRAERASRGQILLDGGIDRLLATLFPSRIRWRMPVLEVLLPGEADIYLAGRGLALVPSVFVGELPVILEDLSDPMAAPRLVFPVGVALPGGTVLEESRSGSRALGALVGRTRAAALRVIAGGCTTSQLARHIGVSAAAASQHATILRDAGLITTRRQGGAVWHALTPLGESLLESA